MYTLIEYQKAALRTAAGRTMATSDTQRDNAILGLAGEIGEVCDLVKKERYHGHALNSTTVMDELGDILWYCALLANSFGWTLDDVAQLNIEKLRKRYPEGFDDARSIERYDR